MRDSPDAVAGGELSPAAVEARLAGYATGEAGRFDAARERRSGVPGAAQRPRFVPNSVGTQDMSRGRV
jgi:hypothetical protein